MKHMLIAIVLVILSGCVAQRMDFSIMQRGGFTLPTPDIPVTVRCSPPHCGDIQRDVDWWNMESGRELFIVSTTEGAPVRTGYLPVNVWGRTTINYNPRDGEVLSMSMIVQEGEWSRTTPRHELGHFLRLDDDRFSVSDLSIMSTPNGRWSRITPEDLRLIQGM